MDNKEMWRQLVEKYPTWADRETVVKLKAGGLKALIDQAFECGREAAVKEVPKRHVTFEERYVRAKWRQLFGEDLFDQTFGKF